MQATTPINFKVAILLDSSSDIAHDIRHSLSEKSTSHELLRDSRGCPLSRYIVAINDHIQCCIEAHCEDLGASVTYSLLTKKSVDLTFALSECLGINPLYKIGDLVVLDPVPSGFEENGGEITQVLPEVKGFPFDPETLKHQTLEFVGNDAKKMLEIKNHFGFEDSNWSCVHSKLIKPNIDRFWSFNSDYRLSLTEEGKKELAKGFSKPEKPQIHFGTNKVDMNECSTQSIRARVKDLQNHNFKFIALSAITCKLNQVEDLRAVYRPTAAESLVAAALKCVEIYFYHKRAPSSQDRAVT